MFVARDTLQCRLDHFPYGQLAAFADTYQITVLLHEQIYAVSIKLTADERMPATMWGLGHLFQVSHGSAHFGHLYDVFSTDRRQYVKLHKIEE